MTCFGWTWEYIDQHMTLQRLSAFERYWESNPPLHQLVARFMGVEPARQNTADENCRAIFAALGIEV